MPFSSNHFLAMARLGAMSLPALAMGIPDDVSAQTTLPGIVVNAPSPIVRHARPAPTTPARTARRGTTRPSAPQQPEIASAPQPASPDLRGTLPIVTDQFATVTVVTNEEIRRNGAATLGDLLNDKPGITGSSYAPGASSRPIIRGLDVNRVGIVENGIGSNGASDLGEDHFVPIDPLSTNQVEVIRGPAALRYGSTAIGGVVSASNNRIPEQMPCGPTPWQAYGFGVKPPATANGCLNAETRSALSSVNNGLEGAVLIDAGADNVAVHADAYGRRADDYAIPGGRYQANTSNRSMGASVGASYLFDGGFIGASIAHNNVLYHIPGDHGADFKERIDGRQNRVTVKGEYRPDSALIDAVRIWLGAVDYRHHERGLEDAHDPSSDGIHQTFTDRSQEGRLEVQLAPYMLGAIPVTTAIGIQGGHQDLAASSPENAGALYNGLFAPNSNSRIGTYIFNEFQLAPTTRAQIAGRVEHVWLNGTMPDFPASFMPDGSAQLPIARDLSFTPASASVGLLQDLPGDLVASVTGQFVQRAPKPAELFSRGIHHATTTFDIGNPNLKIETAQSVEVGLRRAKGPLRFEATGYYTRFNNFIYRRLTGAFCDDDFASCHTHDHHDHDDHDDHDHDDHDDHGHDDAHGHGHHLNQAVYSQRDATFRGGELQFQYDAIPLWNGMFGIEGQYDIVRATFTDGTNVPRIPPQRLGGGFFYRDANWLARINLLHAFAQNNVSDVETPTPGYNRLRAEISYTTMLPGNHWLGGQAVTVGLVGDNLLNEQIRNAAAYNKDQVLLPGLNVRLFANVKY
ncbi:TonB-dependent receptor domain-containing protein [Nitrobacter winogradskyi]|nr:iron complex outermembrane receptor protein [Nitrobacter winogradskyi]